MWKNRHNRKVPASGIVSMVGVLFLSIYSLGWSQSKADAEPAVVTSGISEVFLGRTGLQDAASSVSQKIISVHFEEVQLLEALQQVAENLGMRLSYSKEILPAEKRVSINLEQATVNKVLYTLLEGTGLRYAISEKGSLILFEYLEDPEPLAVLQTVSGTVTDASSGETMPGVNVVVKGTATGTATNAEGKYELNVESLQDTLMFSFIGYRTREVPINGRTTINITLQPETISGDELVVVGYGEKSRTLMTESIGTVSSEDIQSVPIASPDQALVGKVSGAQVSSVDGTPGSPVAIRIRGVGTVGNTQPLFVIDGVPVGKGGDRRTNPLSTINPANIESISVLKDASAAAVYGVRAANGVVLITTKRGENRKPTVSLDTYYGVQSLPELWDMNNTRQYVELTKEAFANFNQQFGFSPGDGDYKALHPDLQAANPDNVLGRDVSWVRDATQNGAPMQNYNLSVSGGNDNLSYFVSGGYFAQEAVVDKWDLQRFNFRANADYTVNDRFKFGESFSLSYQKVFRGVNAGGDGFLLANAAQMPPFFLIYEDPDNPIPGNRYGFNGNFDTAGMTIGNQNGMNQIEDTNERDTRLLGTIYAELELLAGLAFKSSASVDLSLTRNDSWEPGFTARELGFDRTAQIYSDSRGESSTQVFTNSLTYDEVFGNHIFNFFGAIEYQKLRGTTTSARANTFLSTSPDFYRVIKNAQEEIRLGGGAGEGAYVGLIGRLSYNYKDKYLVTGSVRRDGTYRFAPENRWGTFPSFSAAWRISEESFFENIPVISELKIRGSWGQLGNDQTTSFPHVFRVSVTPDYGLNGSTTVQAPAPINFVNKNVTWETVETLDFGIDASLFNDQVNLLATYYRRRTQDFLLGLPIPNITGFGRSPTNVGEVLNRGVELELGYNTTFDNGLNLSLSGNLTTVNNELNKLAPGIREFSSGNYRTAVGFPIGYFYGYKTNGLYQTEEEAAQALDDASANEDPRPGDIRFVDTNGPCDGPDPKVCPEGQQFSGEPDGEIDFNDRTFLGKTIPDFYYGFSVRSSYKSFDLSILLQGESGISLYNQFRRQGERLTGSGRNQMISTANRWTGPGTSNSMPRAIDTDPNSNNRYSDRWIEKADYMRLKNVQLGYSIPKSLLGPATGFSSVRVYASASNLLTLTGYSGPDPSIRTYGSVTSQLGAGTDNGNMPTPRIYQVGLQVQF